MHLPGVPFTWDDFESLAVGVLDGWWSTDSGAPQPVADLLQAAAASDDRQQAAVLVDSARDRFRRWLAEGA